MTEFAPLVSVVDVSKSFGSFQAVDRVSLDIKPGEFFSLLGPSGCGKTTLLRILAGFDAPSSGEVYIGGEPSSRRPPNHRPTNMVFQSYALFPHLTIAQNIAYGLRTLPIGRDEKASIVQRSLGMIRLADKAHQKPHQLSGGQRQRVALARALARHPKVLLLDEPLSALDKKLREEMQFELRELQRRVGITFVFVTHDQDEALAMSDRIAIMSHGRVLQVDTPSKIYEAPTSREVAAFIGTMNFFSGRLLSIEGGRSLVDAGSAGKIVAMSNASAACICVGDDVLVAVRPEKIRIDGLSLGNFLRGEVMTSSYLGDRNHLLVRVNGVETPVAVATQNVTRNRAQPTSNVSLTWPAESSILLPLSKH